MKTSNKILIIFAAALILIPVLGMIIVSATQYKTGTYKDVVYKIENFSTATKNMESIAVSTPFETVNVPDAKGMGLNVKLIKDDKFGIKIHNDFKGLVTATVDANGQLQIVIKNKPKSDGDNDRYYTNIYVYAPNVKGLNITNTSNLSLSATTDTLALNVQKSDGISFGEGTNIKQLNVKAVDAKSVFLREDEIKSITLDLQNTNLRTDAISFDNLSITTAGKCEIELNGGYDNEKMDTINNLTLNTNGIADVKLDRIKVANCSGKLSDETQVQMPAINLNQMYSKNK